MRTTLALLTWLAFGFGCGSTNAADFVWVDDDFPKGANRQTNPDTPATKWVTTDDGRVFSGKKALERTATGVGQDFFPTCSQPLVVGEKDTFFAYVYLDPKSPPKSIMLQFHSTNWIHRANWGDADAIPFGEINTTNKVIMGALPETGKWVRLEVEAEKMGLTPGTIVTGMAFTQFDGTVTWDKAGIAGKIDQTTDLAARLKPYYPDAKEEETTWIDDDFPEGAVLKADGAELKWVTADTGRVFSGTKAIERTAEGLAQDYFMEVGKALTVGVGGKLSAYVFIDAVNPPKAIMLQFHSTTSGWSHRAIWGDAEAIPYGDIANQTKTDMGKLPESGKWIKLEVSPLDVGLHPGTTLTGWAFTQSGGKVTWDKAGYKGLTIPKKGDSQN
jgi:hypothetical protein